MQGSDEGGSDSDSEMKTYTKRTNVSPVFPTLLSKFHPVIRFVVPFGFPLSPKREERNAFQVKRYGFVIYTAFVFLSLFGVQVSSMCIKLCETSISPVLSPPRFVPPSNLPIAFVAAPLNR